MSRALTDLFGHDPESWSVQRHLEGMHPDDVPGYRAAQAAFLKGRAARSEFTYRTHVPSGDYRWIHDRRVAEHNSAGRVIRMTGTTTDITGTKEQEAQNRAYAARPEEASIEVLKAISETPDDTQPVFELIAMTGFDGPTMHARVMDGVTPEARAGWFASYPRPPGPETLNGRVTLAGEVLPIRDLDADAGIDRAGRMTGAKSFMGVPLLRDGQASAPSPCPARNPAVSMRPRSGCCDPSPTRPPWPSPVPRRCGNGANAPPNWRCPTTNSPSGSITKPRRSTC